MSDNLDFYKAFEDKHRGSRELIKARLGVYRLFITPLLELFPDTPAVDLGCGRGEWLELLKDIGFSGIGVDLDAEMLNAAKLNNLNVEQADAVEYLKHQPDECLSIVSAFHVAEHLPFDALQILVQESLRVLKPGGLLILETPNPENITVGANSFYLDPTHERPLPQELLSFLPEYYGFARTGVLRLQEREEIKRNKSALRLIDVFTGVSPDYAVVAQKKGNEQALLLLESVFNQTFGVSLEYLASRYEQRLLQGQADVVDRLQAVTNLAEEAVERADEAAANAIQSRIATQKMEEELRAVYSSRSWRYTKAARWFSFQWLLFRKLGPVARMKAALRKITSSVLSLLAVWIGANPKLRRHCVLIAQKLGVYSHLRRIYHGGSILNRAAGGAGSSQWRQHSAESLADLTPEAREVYRKLYGALEKRKGSE